MSPAALCSRQPPQYTESFRSTRGNFEENLESMAAGRFMGPGDPAATFAVVAADAFGAFAAAFA